LNKENVQKEEGVVDENSIISDRRNKLDDLRKNGIAFPNQFKPQHFSSELHKNYDGDDKETLEGKGIQVSVSGRMMLKRVMGKASFASIQDNDGRIQLYVARDFINSDSNPELYSQFKKWDLGDIIGAKGKLFKTRTNELTIEVTEIVLLTKSIRPLPEKFHGLSDQETKYRQRYVDLVVNEDTKQTFLNRSKIISNIRTFMEQHKFLEVETPMLHAIPGGATARPFETHHNALDMDMYLRIAPELYLKRLVVGGFDRVYEIGKQFRNESIDRTHSPEFTSVEFYMAYADYNDLMNMAEDFFPKLAMHIHGSYKVKCKSFESDNEIMEVDFTPPFARFDFVGELEKETSTIFPKDLSSEDARVFLDELCNKYNIECSSPRTTTRLLDKLAGHFIEPKCINPSFVINHPAIMSPLAKWHRDNANFSERFELFMLGHEFANAYTELNDPFVQREAFENQLKDKNSGDEEAQDVDNIFIDALECGLPPTGGFGIGIDRLVMLMAGTNRIQDVILFPAMK